MTIIEIPGKTSEKKVKGRIVIEIEMQCDERTMPMIEKSINDFQKQAIRLKETFKYGDVTNTKLGFEFT